MVNQLRKSSNSAYYIVSLVLAFQEHHGKCTDTSMSLYYGAYTSSRRMASCVYYRMATTTTTTKTQLIKWHELAQNI